MIKKCIKQTREYCKHRIKMNEGFNFQSRLKELMEEKGITSNYAMAERCGVDRTTVGRWLEDDHIITLPTLQKICDGLEISFRDFFTTETSERRGNGFSFRLRQKWKALNTELQQKTFLDYGEFGLEKLETLTKEIQNSSLS